MTTSKLLPTSVRFTFCWVNVQAVMAGLRGIARVNQNQLYAKLHRLVGQELSQLIERPTIATSTLCFRPWHRVSSFSDSSQILQSNSLVGQLGALHQTVADDVIYMTLKALLLARQPFQQFSTTTSRTACASRSFLLDIRSQSAVLRRFPAKILPFDSAQGASWLSGVEDSG